ncbi:HAMP domain-containing sensor histidine kinase [Kitasatospora aureofaciens]|uniref:sensor histidine kinase n=1 Tax=Streptomyces tendae TaxID=1932 RepID=UPI002B2C3E92|nr:HAMP domain-containing sensor histidine kinase [Kitasatospora aureofaciens]
MSATASRWSLGRVSLRGRVVTISLLLVVAALLTSNALLVTLLERQLTQQLDDRLRTITTAAARLPVPAEVPDGTPPVAADTAERELVGDVYVAYLDVEGRAGRTLRLATESVPELSGLDSEAVAARDGRPFTVPAEDGGEWRVVAMPLHPVGTSVTGPSAANGSVVVAGSLAEVSSTMRHLGVWMLVIDSLVLLLLGVVAWFALRAGLGPLRRIETTAAAIAGGDLARRVPRPVTTRTELGRLSAALNGMLDRIEAGDAARAATNERMRTFIADASHELRTPLFGIKGFTELYRMGGMPRREDVDSAMSRIEHEAARLVRIVEDLLLLARLAEEPTADAHLPLRMTPMDLRSLAADALHDLRALAPDRPVTLTGPDGGPPGVAPVLGDESRLRQVTSNLVGNAIAHTPPGTPVRIGVGTLGDRAVLELSDEGPGMTAEQATHVFDRFYRADTARTRTHTGGAGLGLSIVHSLVTAHHGRVDVRTAPGHGATFRILLPLHTDTGS